MKLNVKITQILYYLIIRMKKNKEKEYINNYCNFNFSQKKIF